MTDEEGRDSAFDGCDTPSGFAVARHDAIPDAPDIFPALPANPVEKRELKIIRLLPLPAVGDVHHMPGLEPFVAVDPGNKREFVLPPTQQVIRHRLVGRTSFRLEGQGMTDPVRGF